MPIMIHPRFTFSPGSFLLFIASADAICEALSMLLGKTRGRILYLCGNYPVILPLISPVSGSLQVRRALTAYQILSILAESDEQFILFEHDRSLYDDNADLLPTIGEACRQKQSEHVSVILFARSPDKWLDRLEPYAGRVAVLAEVAPRRVLPPSRTTTQTQQQTLDALW